MVAMKKKSGVEVEDGRGHTNFTVVDFGTVISKRSYGEERIAGDMPPHYGLEARLLFAQQLLHELLISDELL